MAASVTQYLQSLEARLAALEGKMGVTPAAAPSGGDAAGGDAGAPEWLVAYDTLLEGKLAPLVATSNDIGGPVAELGTGLADVFNKLRGILSLVPVCKKPSPADLFASPAGKELQSAMKAVNAVNPGEFNNHAKAVMEALPACNWIVVDTMPHSLVEGQRDAAEFWLNKVRVAFKSKGDAHMSWCGQMKDLLSGLYDYVKAHHKTGLTWKFQGKDIADGTPSAAAPAPAAAKPPAAAAAAGGDEEDGAVRNAKAMVNLAAELGKLDQSSGRTKGLRKVTSDMKAKNMKGKPTLKPKAAGAAKKAVPAKKAVVKKDPRLALVGKRWFCEHQTGMVEVNVTASSQEVYIYNCDGATVLVNGKCTALQIDKCVKTQVLFDHVIASVSVVDSKRLKMQSRQSVKSISLDKTDGAMVYLNWESRDAQIATSKCSELNVSFPVSEAEDAEWTEQPIPEQFITVISADGVAQTRISDLYTHG